MKIIVYSEIECYADARDNKISDTGYCIISIRDIGKEPINNFKLRKNVVDVLSLSFDDVIEPSTGMASDDARRVVSFIRSNIKRIDTIVIHCFAGQSRSYTIGLELSKYYNAELVTLNKNVRVNILVQQKMIEQLKRDKNGNIDWT